ncbi:MAG: hypothetical protein AAGJ46_10225 [Planctomycetota bacterium]
MNTPSHIAASLLVWRDEKDWLAVSAVVLGAALPDLPMFGFYAYQKLWRGAAEQEIWGKLYFDPVWQLLFDWFNSMPLAVLLIGVCQLAGFRLGVLVSASALLHMACDLPVHHDDAHRHFLPFTNWRFASPVSYWDPKHHGIAFAIGELLFAVAASWYVGWQTTATPMRVAAWGTLAMYVVGIGFALAVWVL